MEVASVYKRGAQQAELWFSLTEANKLVARARQVTQYSFPLLERTEITFGK